MSTELILQKATETNEAVAQLVERVKYLEKINGRKGIGAATGDDIDTDAAEYKKAYFDGFIRKGHNDGLAELQQKAMNTIVPGDGGFAVPVQQNRQILELMQDQDPMRQVCNVITVGTPEYKQLFSTDDAEAQWVNEDEARPATDTPKLKQLTPYMGELSANPQITQTSLDDIFFDVPGWIVKKLAIAFGKKEGLAFTSGSGVKEPKGFLSYSSAATADASRAFGVLQHKTTASASAIVADELIDLVYSLKAGHRKGASWQMNSLTAASLRKLENDVGDKIWRQGLESGQPDRLLGYPVNFNENLADIGAGKIPLAFGNWRAGYTIVDRVGIRTLRDPYSNKPYVGFYSTKRVGGMLVDSEAIKLLVMHA